MASLQKTLGYNSCKHYSQEREFIQDYSQVQKAYKEITTTVQTNQYEPK